MLIILIDMLSVAIIALVCALSIIRYHRQFGLIINLTLLFLMVSCVSVIIDEHDGARDFYSLEMFRLLAAIASVIIYIKTRLFWARYGVVIMALTSKETI